MGGATKFQYLSDVHLEARPGFRLTRTDVRAPYLILAGDIGCTSTPEDASEYVAFLRNCAALFRTTFLVAGNHEGHGHESWAAAITALRDVVDRAGDEKGDVVLLDGLTYAVPHSDICVAGATLWSRVSAKEAGDVRRFVKDYQRIGNGFDIEDANALHENDLAWLRSVVAFASSTAKRVVVVTHHAPSLEGTSHPKHDGGRVASAFATALDEMLAPPVCAWVHGHTHFSHRTRMGTGTLLLSNQRGYRDCEEEGLTRFEIDASFDVAPP